MVSGKVKRSALLNHQLLLLSRFSRVRLCATPWTAAHQAPPSLGFSRQEHWSGLPFPSPMHESEKWKWSRSVVFDPQRPHGLQPTRLLHPWDFPGKSTGVGCHCLLMTNLDSILKSRYIILPTKVRLVKAMVFPVVMHGCESWTIKKAECWIIDAFNCEVGEDSWRSFELHDQISQS